MCFRVSLQALQLSAFNCLWMITHIWILVLCVFAHWCVGEYIHLCAAVAPEPRRPGAYLQRVGRDGWRLSRGVWASSSGHLITAPAPTACLRLPQPPVFGCIFPGRVRWYALLVSEALVSGGLHLSTKHGCVWLADLNEIPIDGYIVILFVDS